MLTVLTFRDFRPRAGWRRQSDTGQRQAAEPASRSIDGPGNNVATRPTSAQNGTTAHLFTHPGFQMQASSKEHHENVASQKHQVDPATPGSPEPDEALIRRVLTRATLQLPTAKPSPAEAKTRDASGDLPPGTGPYAPDSEQ